MEVQASTVNETDFTAFVADVFKARDYLRQRCQNNEQDADLIELISRMDEFERHVLPRVKSIENVIHKINEGVPSKSEQVLATVLEAVEKHKDEINTLKTKTISTEVLIKELISRRQEFETTDIPSTSDQMLASVLETIEKHNKEITDLKDNNGSIEESLMSHNCAIGDVEHRDIERYENMERQMIFYVEKQNISTKVLGRVLLNYAKLSQRFDDLQRQVNKIHDLGISTNEKISGSQKAIKNLQISDESIKGSVHEMKMKLKDMALQSATVEMVTEVSKKQNELFASVNKKCDETVERIEIQDKKVDEVKAELSKSILESSTKNESFIKKLDNKIFIEEKNRCDDVKKLVSDISLIKETNQKRDTKLEELFKKSDDCIHQRTQIFAIMGELRKKTRDMEENLLLDVGNLQGSVDKLDSKVSRQDETIKGQQVKLEELQVNLDILSKSLTETANDFENKLQREIKNRSERVSRMEVDILLIKSSNKTTDSKLAELKKENDENQKTLQKSFKDLNLKATELGKEVIDMKMKQDTMDQLITSFTEKHKTSIANVEVRCDLLDFQIQVQENKSDQEKIEGSKRLSEFTTQFNSQLQQLDNKIQTETKNMNDQYNTAKSDILLMKHANRTTDSKLNDITKDLSGQMLDIVRQVGELAKDLDSRCLQVRETLKDALFENETKICNLGKCNIETKQKQTTMEEQITFMYCRLEKLQQDGVNFQQFQDSANRWLLNLKVACDTLEDKMTAQGKNVEEQDSKLKSLRDDINSLDSARKNLEQCSKQAHSTLQAKVNQLLSETEETKTAIKQCKQDTQEVQQVQADINNEISATRSKQSYFQVKVDQLLTKINKCEEKCRMLST